MKDRAAHKLADYHEAEKVISYMYDKESYEKDFAEFVSYTDYLDKSRNQDILKELPEYEKYMDLHRK
jgi:hypothetical protein